MNDNQIKNLLMLLEEAKLREKHLSESDLPACGVERSGARERLRTLKEVLTILNIVFEE